MKKRIPLFAKIGLLMMSALFMLSACTEDKYYENPVDWDIAFPTVNSTEWQWIWDASTNTGYYKATKQMNQLTESLVIDGGIIVARDFGGDLFRPLPYTIYDIYPDGADTFSQTVDYEYEPGYIHFYCTYSDLYDGRPESMTFKVTSFY